ncbi:tyrosine-protein phosphatase [Clostridium sp. 'White wine YQ']|uniref:tyrosine-protein phosphatase n=1 Tax=Clostridium sp. 'White wine YQ' TaxID=3027474 RepID=UPI002366B01A|nr:CpsB/CapC family capsule biosynthesis tyrosine phosphatase [Clostridium sp. 'White wine YQ']MDD7792764.1 PHP domain-containing protein [Clostridium sp. 'White wine YQ']
MIDFHSHIIYGIDDGSKDIDMSLSMIENAKEEGTEYICATPHFILGNYEVSLEEYSSKIEELRAKSEINIVSGLEVYMDLKLPELFKEKKIWGINNGPYMLIEFPMREIPRYSNDVLYELSILGVKPIIAHPERNLKLMNNIDILEDWIEEGYLLQVNAGSLVGQYGKEPRDISEILAKRNMIHILGSDGHNDSRRKTNIKSGRNRLEEINPSLSTWIDKNEKKVLLGEDIELPEINELKKSSKSIFGFLKRK